MTRFNLTLTLVLTLLFLVASAAAQERPISGYGVYVPGDAENIVLADGRTLSSSRLRGVLIEDNPESPIHLMSQTCAGTDVLGADGSPVHIAGACTATDADGNVFHIAYFNTPEQGTWRYTGGTGKFDGVTGGGTSEVVALGPDGRFTIRYEGTINMR